MTLKFFLKWKDLQKDLSGLLQNRKAIIVFHKLRKLLAWRFCIGYRIEGPGRYVVVCDLCAIGEDHGHGLSWLIVADRNQIGTLSHAGICSLWRFSVFRV